MEVYMMSNSSKLDPRVVKTRLNLRHALVFLMQSEKLDDISVQKITETAHITRGTFYLHYKDKHDFISRAMQEIIDELFDNVMINNDVDHIAEPVKVFSLNRAFDYIEKNSDIFTILLDRTQNNDFYRQFYARLSDEMLKYGKTMHDELDELDVPIKVQVAFMTSALLGLIAQWLNNGLIYTSRYMTSSVAKMLNTYSGDKLLLTSFFDYNVNPQIKL